MSGVEGLQMDSCSGFQTKRRRSRRFLTYDYDMKNTDIMASTPMSMELLRTAIHFRNQSLSTWIMATISLGHDNGSSSRLLLSRAAEAEDTPCLDLLPMKMALFTSIWSGGLYLMYIRFQLHITLWTLFPKPAQRILSSKSARRILTFKPVVSRNYGQIPVVVVHKILQVVARSWPLNRLFDYIWLKLLFKHNRFCGVAWVYPTFYRSSINSNPSSSGYHFCLTHRRSPVRARAESVIFAFVWHVSFCSLVA